MRELVLFITQSLVSQPDQVQVTEVPGEDGLILKVSVASEDVGKVIGKQGRIAKAIRTVVRAASPLDQRIFVEIDS